MGAWLHEAWQLGWALAIIAIILLYIQIGIFLYLWIKWDNLIMDLLDIINRNKKVRLAKHGKK